MATPLSRLIRRAAYGATQLPRLAWFIGLGFAMRQRSEETRRGGETKRPRPHTDSPCRIAVACTGTWPGSYSRTLPTWSQVSIRCQGIMTAHS
jgi:hypothetical protein